MLKGEVNYDLDGIQIMRKLFKENMGKAAIEKSGECGMQATLSTAGN